MARVQSTSGKQAANYVSAALLAVTLVTWLVFLGWGAWSLIGFFSRIF